MPNKTALPEWCHILDELSKGCERQGKGKDIENQNHIPCAAVPEGGEDDVKKEK